MSERIPVYLVTEISTRELASNVLIAAEAARRGFLAYIIEQGVFKSLLRSGELPRGIVHVKSLKPTVQKMSLHAELKTAGFLLTSLDQEAGITEENFARFAGLRYSDASIAQADAVFCWGALDYEYLRAAFPNHRSRLFKTGSPRAEIWSATKNSSQLNQNGQPRTVLFSSNIGANSPMKLWEIAGQDRISQTEKEFESQVQDRLNVLTYQIRTMASWLKILPQLASDFPNVKFIVRPHPVEDPSAWPALLNPHANISVDSSGSLTEQISRASAVIQNGCTAAIEALLIGTPVLNFGPPSGEPARTGFARSLGTRVSSYRQLRTALDKALCDSDGFRKSYEASNLALLKQRTLVVAGQNSSSAMVDVWHQLVERSLVRAKPKSSKRGKTPIDLPNRRVSKMKVGPKFTALTDQMVTEEISNLMSLSLIPHCDFMHEVRGDGVVSFTSE